MSKESSTNKEVKGQDLILDTHVLIWYAEGIKLLSQQIELIEHSQINNRLFISTITIWEIAMLVSKGKIILNVPIKDWVDRLLSTININLIELSPSILIESSLLPNYEHKDPADRIIIASVRATNSHLMTFDQKIIDYANLGYLKSIVGSNKSFDHY